MKKSFAGIILALITSSPDAGGVAANPNNAATDANTIRKDSQGACHACRSTECSTTWPSDMKTAW